MAIAVEQLLPVDGVVVDLLLDGGAGEPGYELLGELAVDSVALGVDGDDAVGVDEGGVVLIEDGKGEADGLAFDEGAAIGEGVCLLFVGDGEGGAHALADG